MAPELSTALNRPYIPPSGTKLTTSIDVRPGEKEADVERHIALCIDTSGSMSGEKIERARDGANWVFGLLDPADYISITTFDSDAERVLGPSRWADLSIEEARACVNELTAGGKTDMYEGIQNAKESLESLKFYNDNTGTPVRRILVLSDGKDKHHEPAEFRDIAVDVDESGIRIEAAGIGEEYNEETIRTLGTTARGEWTHLEAAGDIENFFGEVVEQARDVVATDATLELTPAPGVELSEVYRAIPQAQEVDLTWEDETAIIKLPDLTAGDAQEVVMQLHAPATDEGLGEAVLGEVTLTAHGEEASDTITVTYTDDNEKLAVNNEDVQLSHQQTVIKTALGKGNVDAAETQVEKMTQIHGKETEVVTEVKRETEIVKEGGRAEQNRATKIVTDDDGVQK